MRCWVDRDLIWRLWKRIYFQVRFRLLVELSSLWLSAGAALNSNRLLVFLSLWPSPSSKPATNSSPSPHAPILLNSLSATSLTKLFTFKRLMWLGHTRITFLLPCKEVRGVTDNSGSNTRGGDHGDQNPTYHISHFSVPELYFITSLDHTAHHFNHILLLSFIFSPHYSTDSSW